MTFSSLGRVVRGAMLVGASIMPVAASAQSVWLPTSGSTPWTTGTAWSDGIIPSAVDAVTVFPSAAPTVLLDDTTVTVGTINQTTASGNVVIGTTGSTGSVTDWIDLAVTSGVPTISVSGGNLYMYAQLSGSQGLQKNGGGIYSPRYNSLDFTYTGTNYFNGGVIQIARGGHLGNAANPIEVLATTNLQNYAATTFDAARSISVANGTVLTAQNGAASNSLTLNGPITGGGGLTLTTGSFALNGANTHTGTTTIRSATVTLGPSSPLSTTALILQTSATNTGGSRIDLGGQSQAVSALTLSLANNSPLQATNTFLNGSLAVTGGNLTVNSGAATARSGTTQLNLGGLSAFSYTNAAAPFAINTTGTQASGTFATVVNLPTVGTASVTASHVQVGNSANGPAASTSSLGLGQTNTLNTGTLTIGAYRGNGSVAFQPDVTGGTLTLRGIDGGDSRVDNVYVGYKSGGDNFGKGVLDVSAGSIDARVTNFTIGQYIVYASSNQTGTFGMTSGTLDTTTLTLGTVIVSTGSVGTPPISSIFNQAGGTVKAATAVFGNNAGTAGVGNAPTFASVYNLSSGTFALGSLAAGVGTSGTTSQRRLNWNGGTIATYDAATDLTMSGTSGAGGALIVTLGGSDPKTFDIGAGRTATLGDYVTLTGSGGFTKAGAGTLVVGSQTGATATYAGPTTVVGGTLVLATGSAVGSSPIAVAAGATARIAGYTSTTLAGLDLSANGLMDVTTGLLTISSGMTAPQLVAELLEGRGDGSWNGTSGITSSVAAAEVALNIPRAVGWLDNGDGSMTVAYAAPGDTNIDWVVDILDVANFLVPGKFNTGAPATWLEGDFNYDGIVDILDTSGFLSTGLYDVGNYNTPPAVGGIAAVPEPSAWALLGAGIVAAVAARRPRRGLMS